MLLGGGDFWRWLFWQRKIELVEDELNLLRRFCVTAENHRFVVSGWQMHVEHADGGQAFQDAAGRKSGCGIGQSQPQGCVEAIGEEGDKDVRFNALLILVMDRSYAQITFEVFEGFFDLDELRVEFPQLSRIVTGKIVAQQIASFATKPQASSVLSPR